MTQTMTQAERTLAKIKQAENNIRVAKENQVSTLIKKILAKAKTFTKYHKKAMELHKFFFKMKDKSWGKENMFHTSAHGNHIFFSVLSSSEISQYIGILCNADSHNKRTDAMVGLFPIRRNTISIGNFHENGYNWNWNVEANLSVVFDKEEIEKRIGTDLDDQIKWLNSVMTALNYFDAEFNSFYNACKLNAQSYLDTIAPHGVKMPKPRKTTAKAKKAAPKKIAAPAKSHAEILVSGFKMRENDMERYLPQAYFAKFNKMTAVERKAYMIKLVASVNASFGEVLKEKFKSVVRQTLTLERHAEASKTAKKK